MPDYDIPLSTIYEEDEGKRVLIQQDTPGEKITLVDRRGDPPDDIVPLYEGEAEELLHVLIAFLARDNDGTLGQSRTGHSFEEYRTD